MVIHGILDTSIIIDVLRNHAGATFWVQSLRTSEYGITPIVWMETIEGAMNRTERDQAARLLRQFVLCHPTNGDTMWAIRQHMIYVLSHRIEFTDCMIASVAVGLSTPLYTQNIKHYAPLPSVDERRPYT